MLNVQDVMAMCIEKRDCGKYFFRRERLQFLSGRYLRLVFVEEVEDTQQGQADCGQTPMDGSFERVDGEIASCIQHPHRAVGQLGGEGGRNMLSRECGNGVGVNIAVFPEGYGVRAFFLKLFEVG